MSKAVFFVSVIHRNFEKIREISCLYFYLTHSSFDEKCTLLFDNFTLFIKKKKGLCPCTQRLKSGPTLYL